MMAKLLQNLIRKNISRTVKRWPFAYSIYQMVVEHRALSRAPTRSHWGFNIRGNQQMMLDEFEPIESNTVNQLLKHVDMVVNVGANVGYYSLMGLVNRKDVIAFEPMPRNLRLLYDNILSNTFEAQFECFPIALSSTTGLQKIYGSGTGASLIKGWAGSNDYIVVPTSTLDDVLGNRFADKLIFFIVDIEGAEYEMLRGARHFLTSDKRPMWLVEICISEHQPAGLAINPNLVGTFDLFFGSGYRAFSVTRGYHEVLFDEILTINATGVDSLDTHNFLFLHNDQVKLIDSLRLDS